VNRRSFLIRSAAALGLATAKTPLAEARPAYTFRDEFDGPAGSAPNRHRWRYDIGRWTDNDELQTYTDTRSNSFLDGRGHLVIRALRSGSGYTSARLKTEGTFAQRFGTWEARIKCDHTRGTWPAWWMLGSDYPHVGWPRCGEVDMLEVYGSPAWRPDSTVRVAGPGGNEVAVEAVVPGGVDNGWHVWRLVWTPAGFAFYKDPKGASPRPYLSVERRHLPSWPFGRSNPCFMILDLAVGGRGGGPVPASFSSAQLLIDYVRVTAH
jgi:beta-glucanase (GH16 family)